MSKTEDKLKQTLERENLRAQIQHARLKTQTARKAAKGLSRRRKPAGPSNYSDSYEATTRTRLRPGYRARPGNHNAHLDPNSQEALRRDTRALDRNNPLARALLSRLADSVIGRGFNIQSQALDLEWRKEAEEFWRRWFDESIDVRGMALGTQFDRVVIRSVANDGDLGIVKLDNGQLQLVEGERIRTPSDKKNDRTYVAGVEMDMIGRPLAYHVADTGGKPVMMGFSRTTRIPAEFFEFLANPLHQRVNQTRGEPVLSATITLLEQLDDLVDARVVKNRLEAYIALAIKSEDAGGMQQSLITQAQAAVPGIATGYNTGEAQPQKWEPGGVLNLGVNEEAKVIGQEGNKTNLDEEVIAFIRLICADIGLPITLSMFNSSDTTYHGFKAEISVAWRGFFRWIEMLSKLKRRLWRWRIGMAIYNGELPDAEGWEKIKVGIPPMPMIAPKEEYEAAAMAINQSIRSRRDVVAELFGVDVDDLYAEIKAEREAEKKDGTGPVAMPGQQSPVAKNDSSTPAQPAPGGKQAA